MRATGIENVKGQTSSLSDHCSSSNMLGAFRLLGHQGR